VLGDLFEMWLGDDNISALNQQVIEQFKHYTTHQGELFIAHGNRDFLLGENFTRQCGATLISEDFQLNWENRSICLMHGDILCTDDTGYQKFRTMVRNIKWQSEFLGVSITKRLEIAEGIRQQSKQAQKQKDVQIMDVNPQAVKDYFLEQHCEWLIHGHTHREAKHRVDLGSGRYGTRIVLSDWGREGHYLELRNNQFKSCFFKL